MILLLGILEMLAFFGAVRGLVLSGPQAAEQALALCLCCAATFYYHDLYDVGIVRGFYDFLTRLPGAIVWSGILLAVVWGLSPDLSIPAAALGAVAAALVVTVICLRAACYALLRCRRFRERLVILGTGKLARRLREEIEARPHLRYEIVGFIAAPARRDGTIPSADLKPCLGPVQEIDRIMRESAPDKLVVALAERRGSVPVHELVQIKLDGIAVEDGEELFEQITGRISLEALSPSSFVFGRRSGKSRLNLAIARATSLCVSAAGLALTAPLFPLIALAILIDSRGPIFYLQDRVGLRGRRFRMLKFRTMRPTAREASAWAADNKQRITRVGVWLRKFRLDELPQFVNILRGDMNLEGPRPHPVSNYELFAANIGHYALRLAVRPGVTGWAQTRYEYANNLEEETEKVRYDLYYIKHMSTWLDLRILFDTIKVVLLGRRSDVSGPLPTAAREGQAVRLHDTAA